MIDLVGRPGRLAHRGVAVGLEALLGAIVALVGVVGARRARRCRRLVIVGVGRSMTRGVARWLGGRGSRRVGRGYLGRVAARAVRPEPAVRPLGRLCDRQPAGIDRVHERRGVTLDPVGDRRAGGSGGPAVPDSLAFPGPPDVDRAPDGLRVRRGDGQGIRTDSGPRLVGAVWACGDTDTTVVRVVRVSPRGTPSEPGHGAEIGLTAGWHIHC